MGNFPEKPGMSYRGPQFPDSSRTRNFLDRLKLRREVGEGKEKDDEDPSLFSLLALGLNEFMEAYGEKKEIAASSKNSEKPKKSPPETEGGVNKTSSDQIFVPAATAISDEAIEAADVDESAQADQEPVEDKLAIAKRDLDRLLGGKVKNANEFRYMRKGETIRQPIKDLMNDPNRTVFVGDSINHGFQLKLGRLWNKRNPGFIGKDGLSTGRILSRMRLSRNKRKLKNKDLVVLGGGGNDSGKISKSMGNFREMIKILHEQRVKEVVIYTRFPRGKVEWQYDKDDSEATKAKKKERWEKRKKHADDLREAMLAENWAASLNMSEHPMKIHVVDLHGHFTDPETGYLEESARDPNGDKLHPRGGYTHALNIIGNTLSRDDEDESGNQSAIT